ncbi:hypothetical protein LOTGIDRAFT_153476 [Lottia gigantea]|uniref:Uncharacterized protein n=1 Tax=Lottia gigantea TaxID=225164 RepID=V4BY17_LOTGI|nr:hypothetical protein LOTGIDRAFT_153476 [Lottia gigantea]ESO93999.1 hypothetical protein LOTGIDRAFT_153476 [Lottia gigantea]
MSMLTRAGTMVRKPRRSSASRAVPRRRSAPTVLQGRSQSKQGQHKLVQRISSTPHSVRSYPNSPGRTRSPQDSPATKSVTFFPRDLSPKRTLELSFKYPSDISQDSLTGLGAIGLTKHGSTPLTENSPAKSVSFFLNLPQSTEVVCTGKDNCVVKVEVSLIRTLFNYC